MTMQQWVGLISTVAALAVVIYAFWRADDFEEARREGWLKRGQGREDEDGS